MPKIELEIEHDNYLGFLKDPKSTDIKHFETLLSFYEANKLKRGNANVRPPEPKKRPYKAMLETIENSPDTFHRKNRGITYICNEAKYDNGVLTITIPEDSDRKKTKFGIADGGHTFDVVARTVAEEKDYKHIETWSMPYVRVHFFVTQASGDIEPIVEALNTSTQVQQFTLDEYQNKFSSLKGALEDGGFDLDLVAFRENEGKEWNVIEVIQRMACFLPERWAVHQPVNMYKSKNKALKLFTNEETLEEFKSLYPVIKDVITLPEYIQSQFSMGQVLNDRRVGKLNGVRALKKPWTRPGTDYATEHKFNTAITLPLAAAFRCLLMKHGDQYVWIRDYKEIFEHCAENLYKHLTTKSNKYDLISQISSDVDYWAGAMMIVMRAKDELLSSGPIVRKKRPVETEKQEDESQEEFSQVEEEETAPRKKRAAVDSE